MSNCRPHTCCSSMCYLWNRPMTTTGKVWNFKYWVYVSQLPKYGIPYRLTFCGLKHSLHLDVIWKPTLLLVTLPCPLAPIPKASWFSSETLALYTSLTYMFFSFSMLWSVCVLLDASKTKCMKCQVIIPWSWNICLHFWFNVWPKITANIQFGQNKLSLLVPIFWWKTLPVFISILTSAVYMQSSYKVINYRRNVNTTNICRKACNNIMCRWLLASRNR